MIGNPLDRPESHRPSCTRLFLSTCPQAPGCNQVRCRVTPACNLYRSQQLVVTPLNPFGTQSLSVLFAAIMQPPC